MKSSRKRKRRTSVNQKLAAALDYAAKGYRVLPLRPNSKVPLIGNWTKEASTDEAIIREWWESTPDANVGIATAGLLVIDIDVGAQWPTDDDLRRELESAPTQKTRSGGKHHVFRQPADKAWKSNAKKIARKVDIRAVGGQIVVWPYCVQGGEYAWLRELPSLDELPEPSAKLTAIVDAANGAATSRQVLPPATASLALARVLKKLPDARPSGQGWLASCPAHDDRHPSLSIGVGNDGRALVHCHSGCSAESVVGAIGLRMTDLFQARSLATDGSDDEIERRKIEMGDDEARVTTETLDAIAERLSPTEPKIVIFGDSLARVLPADNDLPSRIDVLSEASLREHITRVVEFTTVKGLGENETEKAVHVPRWVTQAILARKVYPTLPSLRGVIEAPTLRADGSLLQRPGYDPASKLWLSPAMAFPTVPENATRADALDAVAHLLEVVSDFPFERPHHRSACLAFALTAVARNAFSGPAPLFAITANTRGAGKSLLADVVAMLALGRPAPRMAYASDDDELRKRITAIARDGRRFVLLDNIAGTFGSPSLDAALTSVLWEDRVLGESRTMTAPFAVTWSMTANNPIFAADSTRRVVPIVLQSPEERPEEREGFRYPRLLDHVQRHRGELVPAALTILRAYVVAGRPNEKLKPIGSFEEWSDLIRQAIVWAGLDDPAAGRLEIQEHADRDAVALRALVDGLVRIDTMCQGLRASEIQRKVFVDGENDQSETIVMLREALSEACGGRNGVPTAKSIGYLLARLQGRVVNRQAIRGVMDRNSKRWSVVHAGLSEASEASELQTPPRTGGRRTKKKL